MHFLLALSLLAVSASAIPAPISSDDICLVSISTELTLGIPTYVQ
jgi:hypothetical protein